MLNQGPSLSAFPAACTHHLAPALPYPSGKSFNGELDDGAEWSDEAIVYLHWRLLEDVRDLANPMTPLSEKLDTLHWVFTDPEKDTQPFSFASCIRIVGCSPQSPIPYCGLVEADDIRSYIGQHAKGWLMATLTQYPQWVREAVIDNLPWVDSQLGKNPQWINEQVKKHASQSDLFM